jgi:hypothetical protein
VAAVESPRECPLVPFWVKDIKSQLLEAFLAHEHGEWIFRGAETRQEEGGAFTGCFAKANSFPDRRELTASRHSSSGASRA